MKRHEHADLIIAWANGSEIECLEKNRAGEGFWVVVKAPRWFTGVKYRVKPKAKEKKLVPFDESDVHDLVGKTVKTDYRCCLITIASSSIKGHPSVFVQGEWIHTASLLSRFTFPDGSRCGKYIEE